MAILILIILKSNYFISSLFVFVFCFCFCFFFVLANSEIYKLMRQEYRRTQQGLDEEEEVEKGEEAPQVVSLQFKSREESGWETFDVSGSSSLVWSFLLSSGFSFLPPQKRLQREAAQKTPLLAGHAMILPPRLGGQDMTRQTPRHHAESVMIPLMLLHPAKLVMILLMRLHRGGELRMPHHPEGPGQTERMRLPPEDLQEGHRHHPGMPPLRERLQWQKQCIEINQVWTCSCLFVCLFVFL